MKKAIFEREGLIVSPGRGRTLPWITGKWGFLNAGIGIVLAGEPEEGFAGHPGALDYVVDEFTEEAIKLQPPIGANYVTADKHPQIIALLRQRWREVNSDASPRTPYEVEVPTVEEAKAKLREGAFGFKPINII
jgi:hypothetical protein